MRPVGLSDLVESVRTLGLRGEEIGVAAELLGLRRVVSRAPAAAEVPARPSAGAVGSVAQPEAPAVPESAAPVAGERSVAVYLVEKPAPVMTLPLAGRPLSELLPAGPPPPPAARGLFASSARRALLRGVSAVRVRDGEIDLDAVIERLAANRTLGALPREWIETTRGELELLLDVGVAMDPYRDDVERLPGELARVVGEDGLKLRWFEDFPADVFGPHDLEPFVLPAAGARILAVTAFGRRRHDPEWRRLGARCRRNGIPLLVLTPLPPGRRPAGIAAVTWDRTTGVRDVRRALR